MPIRDPLMVANVYAKHGQSEKLGRSVFGKLIDDGVKGYYLLFIYCLVEGKGRAGAYLDSLIAEGRTIRVPNVTNYRLAEMLVRRGFTVTHEYVPCLETHCEVYIRRVKPDDH